MCMTWTVSGILSDWHPDAAISLLCRASSAVGISMIATKNLPALVPGHATHSLFHWVYLWPAYSFLPLIFYIGRTAKPVQLFV